MKLGIVSIKKAKWIQIGITIDLDYDIDEQELRLMITSPDYTEE